MAAIRLALVVAALLGAAAPAPSLAADNAATVKARARIKKARSLYEAGKFDAAVAEYLAAYRLIELSDILFNVGQIYEVKDEPPKALDFYLKYLGVDPDGRFKAEAKKRVVEMAEKCLPGELHEKFRAARALHDAATGEEREKLDAKWTEFYGKLAGGDVTIVEDLDALAVKKKKKPPEVHQPEDEPVVVAPVRKSKPPWKPAPLPRYAKKWWFWTSIGGGAALILTIGLAAGLGSQSDPTPTIGILK